MEFSTLFVETDNNERRKLLNSIADEILGVLGVEKYDSEIYREYFSIFTGFPPTTSSEKSEFEQLRAETVFRCSKIIQSFNENVEGNINLTHQIEKEIQIFKLKLQCLNNDCEPNLLVPNK